ncbi:MAG: restriction endonuclease subunit S [Spirosomataceae bacterium]
MKKYDSYKNSGIEWIGEIPSHWESTKLKFVGESIIGIIYSPDDVVNQGEGILVLRSSNIQDGKLAFEDCVFVDKDVNEKHLTKEGDILLCARNGSAHLVGKAAYIDKENEGVTFGAFMSIVRSELDKYLFYFFNSQVFKAQTGLFSTSTINQLTSDTLNNMFISFPKGEQEQTAIAAYLDRKTAEIDALIADKKRLLALYEEEKTALINQAVTKGIHPDVPMKDSSIDWLGEIPAHWEVKRLKYVASINDEVLTENTEEDFKIEYVEISGVKSGTGIVETTTYRFKDAPSRARRIVRDGDVLVSTVRTYLKSIAKVDNPPENLIASTGFAVIRPNNINSDYTGFLFYSEPLIGEIISLSTGVSYPAINGSQIGDIKIPIPPNNEQIAISEFIENNVLMLDKLKEKTEKLIDLLTEYRTALISEVVTGKVKVV